MLDLMSFGLGFAVAPVVYLLLAAAVYGVLSAAKWLAASIFHLTLTVASRFRQARKVFRASPAWA